VDFYQRFGPSARQAYQYADKPTKYENILKDKLGKPAFETLDRMLYMAKGNMADKEDILYKLVLVSPGRSRNDFIMTVPTVHQYDYNPFINNNWLLT
jgi:hypothetical protein